MGARRRTFPQVAPQLWKSLPPHGGSSGSVLGDLHGHPRWSSSDELLTVIFEVGGVYYVVIDYEVGLGAGGHIILTFKIKICIEVCFTPLATLGLVSS